MAMNSTIVKLGAYWPVAGTRLVSWNHFYADVGMFVHECVSTPKAINI